MAKFSSFCFENFCGGGGAVESWFIDEQCVIVYQAWSLGFRGEKGIIVKSKSMFAFLQKCTHTQTHTGSEIHTHTHTNTHTHTHTHTHTGREMWKCNWFRNTISWNHDLPTNYSDTDFRPLTLPRVCQEPIRTKHGRHVILHVPSGETTLLPVSAVPSGKQKAVSSQTTDNSMFTRVELLRYIYPWWPWSRLKACYSLFA
jgi:hypothetical protein